MQKDSYAKYSFVMFDEKNEGRPVKISIEKTGSNKSISFHWDLNQQNSESGCDYRSLQILDNKKESSSPYIIYRELTLPKSDYSVKEYNFFKRTTWCYMPGIIHTIAMQHKIANPNNRHTKDIRLYNVPGVTSVLRCGLFTFTNLTDNRISDNWKKGIKTVDAVLGIVQIGLLISDFYMYDKNSINGFNSIIPRQWIPPDPPNDPNFQSNNVIFPLNFKFSF